MTLCLIFQLLNEEFHDSILGFSTVETLTPWWYPWFLNCVIMKISLVFQLLNHELHTAILEFSIVEPRISWCYFWVLNCRTTNSMTLSLNCQLLNVKLDDSILEFYHKCHDFILVFSIVEPWIPWLHPWILNFRITNSMTLSLSSQLYFIPKFWIVKL